MDGRGKFMAEKHSNILKNIRMSRGQKIPIQKQIVEKLSAAQEYKTQLLVQRAKLKELFDSALAKSMLNK